MIIRPQAPHFGEVLCHLNVTEFEHLKYDHYTITAPDISNNLYVLLNILALPKLF